MSEVTDPKILASHFAACFSTKSGQVVLAYYRKMFYDNQPAFIKNGKEAPYDVIEAAIRDGRRQPVEMTLNQIKSHEQRDEAPKQTKAKR